MPGSQKPDGTVAGSSKRLASRFFQMKTGHCLTMQYLHWTKNRSSAQRWWCKYRTQTQDHLFKVCPEWRAQQKLCTEVREESGRCGQMVLELLSTTDVRRLVVAEEEARNKVGMGAQGAQRVGRGEEGGGRIAGCRGGAAAVSPHALLRGSADEEDCRG